MTSKYQASKSRSQGREGWCVIFRHPVRLDARGKALRVRRGLATRDDDEANELVAELNEMLADRSYWTPAACGQAAREFDERVVGIFFDGVEPEQSNGWGLREEHLPLPNKEHGYSRVLLLGATGAGKTTLVRQLIGSDPWIDRFPSTSTAKTTIADIEIILADGPYSGAVSFFSHDLVRLYVEECVIAAISRAAEGASERRVLDELMEHREQRFRLAYVIGKPNASEPTSDDEWGDGEDTEQESGDEIEVAPDERVEYARTIANFVERVHDAADRHREQLEEDLECRMEALGTEHRDFFQQLLEENLYDDEAFVDLVDDIMDQIEDRLALLDGGEVERSSSGWPKLWTFTSEDRAEFIRAVNRFTSNYEKNFGKLLTPLVEGIRVSGPFSPSWRVGQPRPKLVLMDGEGLSHTPASAESLPTAVTRTYPKADAIVLVDSAQQPMLGAPLAALRSITASGHDPKLIVAFTHFDLVKGANLRSRADRETHVRRSLDGAIGALEPHLGSAAVRGLRRNLEDRVVFLAGIDQRLHQMKPASMSRYTQQSLDDLLERFEKAIAPPEGTPAVPEYDLANFVLAVASGVESFRSAWDWRLGQAYRAGKSAEHWTRVKALTRRLGLFKMDHYDTLQPVANLIRDLNEALLEFIINPRAWDPATSTDEAKQAATEAVRREVFQRLHAFVSERIQAAPYANWVEAFQLRGRGSGIERRGRVWSIYLDAAPRPSSVPTPESAQFLDDLRTLFAEAVDEAGGAIVGSTSLKD